VVTGFRYPLLLEDGEPADPAGFVVGEPPGRWKVGDVFFTDSGRWFRVLEKHGPPEGEVPEVEAWDGVWTVEPVQVSSRDAKEAERRETTAHPALGQKARMSKLTTIVRRIERSRETSKQPGAHP
jgi:hypothetical protein